MKGLQSGWFRPRMERKCLSSVGVRNGKPRNRRCTNASRSGSKKVYSRSLRVTATNVGRNRGAVERRVGRLPGTKHPCGAVVRCARGAQCPGGSRNYAGRRWRSWREWARRSEGCYLLRINVTDWTPEELWRAYVQLTEAEATFRVHKSDLQIRPVWHHREHRVGAHILVCFLAYVLWKTLAASCQQAGLGDEPAASV